MTWRGRLIAASALAAYLIGWAFGTVEIDVVAVGLAIACVFALGYVRLVAPPHDLIRVVPGEHVEEMPLLVQLELRRTGALAPRRVVVMDDAGPLGRRAVPLEHHLLPDGRQVLRGSYTLTGVHRGRYRFGGARLLLEDPFGIGRRELPLDRQDVLLVYPRLVELDSLVSPGGRDGARGRFIVSRVSGYDLHGVRDYQPGESLRQVHWKTTARLRKLMVKELEDAPRDEAAVLLDASADCEAGSPPDSSFEMAVRTAGSLLARLAQSGRRSALIVSSRTVERRNVVTAGDWLGALELLAAVKPDGVRPLAAILAERHELLEAARLWIVTSDLRPALADRVRLLTSARREVALAVVDPDGWRASPLGDEVAAHTAEGLRRAGVTVVFIRRGDDLRLLLAAREREGLHA